MPTFLPGPAPHLAQRRVGGDARAQQRRGGGRVEVVRHAQHEGFVDHQLRGVAAVGDVARHAVLAVVGADEAVLAVLLEAFRAARAGAAGVDQTADADQLADLEARHLRANRGDAAHDFVARHHREDRVAPFVARLVQIGVADAAVQHVDLDVEFAQVARLEFERGEFGFRVLCGIGMRNIHGVSSQMCREYFLRGVRSVMTLKDRGASAAPKGTQ